MNSPKFTPTFKALLREAQFTKELLGAGATQVRGANYAAKGLYFQAFTSLSTGFERIGKLCLMLDSYIETQGRFPSMKQLKHEIGHKLEDLYLRSQSAVARRAINLRFTKDLSSPVHQAILSVLHGFAEGDRYSNIDVLVGGSKSEDPVSRWFKEVDVPLYEEMVTMRKKQQILHNARIGAQLAGAHVYVLHTSETDSEITDFEESSVRTGIYQAVAPHRQLAVLQIIRYWVELLGQLERIAQRVPGENIPYFGEVFALFYNDDSYMKTRKTWERL